MDLTFGQSIGVEPMPSQAAIGEITQETRALIWGAVRGWLKESYSANTGIGVSARGTLTRWWIRHKHRMIDEAPGFYEFRAWERGLKAEVTASFPTPFNLVQFLLNDGDFRANKMLVLALENSRAAYRVVDSQIVPFVSEEEHGTIISAFEDVVEGGATGARTHLRAAADELTNGNWAGATHESISAIESAARHATNNDKLDLRAAVSKLRSEQVIAHPTLGEVLNKLYAYASDEKGVRHSLGSESHSKVGEAEAMFVFGASASAVSYLLRATK